MAMFFSIRQLFTLKLSYNSGFKAGNSEKSFPAWYSRRNRS